MNEWAASEGIRGPPTQRLAALKVIAKLRAGVTSIGTLLVEREPPSWYTLFELVPEGLWNF